MLTRSSDWITSHASTNPAGLHALETLRLRTGVNCGLNAFTGAVCDAYNQVRDIPDEVVVDRFQKNGSQDALKHALLAAQPALDGAREILFVGCGLGLGGRGASVGLSVIGGISEFTDAKVNLLNITAESLAMGLPELHARPPFDVLITHSFVHYLIDPSPFLETVVERIAPGGLYIMAHEPNRRYYEGAKPAQEERLSPLQILRSLNVLPSRKSTAHRVNQTLKQRVGLRDDLTIDEIRAIVDPHSPGTARHSGLYGMSGLDWDELRATYFRDFELESIGVYGAPPEEEFPRDRGGEFASGPLFSAAWRQLPSPVGIRD